MLQTHLVSIRYWKYEEARRSENDPLSGEFKYPIKEHCFRVCDH